MTMASVFSGRYTMAGSLWHSGKATVALDHNPGGGASLSGRCLTGVDTRSQGLSEFVAIDEEANQGFQAFLTVNRRFSQCEIDSHSSR
jgi:hypothetical protein